MTVSQLRGRRERLTTKIQLGVNYDYHLPLGLRTLCIAMAELDPDEFQRWSDIYYKASTSLENREKNVDEAAELIEKVCYFWTFDFTGIGNVSNKEECYVVCKKVTSL